jgi:hypothetical protein
MILDDENEEKKVEDKFKGLASWIIGRTDEWRTHRQQNYDKNWKEFYNTWRGIFTEDSRTRESERAKLISPATQQAIESKVSEVEEAIFGRGDFFDIEADTMDQPQVKQEVEKLKTNLTQDFKRDKVRKSIGDILLNGAIFGTGIGEVVVQEKTFLEPATEAIPGAQVAAVGTMEKKRFSVSLKPIQPNRFLIDPTATSVDEGLGCAVEDFISPHTIMEGIHNGTYFDVDFELVKPESEISATFDVEENKGDGVDVIRYYGLVPKELIEPADEDVVNLFDEEEAGTEQYEDLVEAIVVIVNGSKVIKAERNPYMMGDRPVLAYQDDIVPNSFWGRGVAEKAYNSQKALDTELRARIDNLALTSVPMMGMDASRLPRGSKFKVKPGASILTNGNPSEILKPLTFGQLDQNSYQQAREFERMLLQATGTTDAGAVTSAVGGETNNGALSMALGLLIKRNKRTLVNFQEGFLIPFVEKAAWRYMQFDPDRYPAKNYRFIAVASMGIMAREYETQQIAFLMQTMGAESPFYPLLLSSLLENSSVHNREQLLAQVQQASQPNPQQQKMQELQAQIQMETLQAQLALVKAQAQKAMADAQKVVTETQFIPQEAQAKIIAATTNNLADDPADKAFQQRLALTDRMLKEKEIASNEKITMMQMKTKETKVGQGT